MKGLKMQEEIILSPGKFKRLPPLETFEITEEEVELLQEDDIVAPQTTYIKSKEVLKTTRNSVGVKSNIQISGKFMVRNYRSKINVQKNTIKGAYNE